MRVPPSQQVSLSLSLQNVSCAGETLIRQALKVIWELDVGKLRPVKPFKPAHRI